MTGSMYERPWVYLRSGWKQGARVGMGRAAAKVRAGVHVQQALVPLTPRTNFKITERRARRARPASICKQPR